MIHIEPCPFCGCTLEKSETFSTRSTTYFVHPYVDEDEQCVASSIRVPVSDRKDDNDRLASWNRRAPTPQPNETCERCQGNGEIVTDWERYRHPHEGDKGDEAVAECPDCGGEGIIDVSPSPQARAEGGDEEPTDLISWLDYRASVADQEAAQEPLPHIKKIRVQDGARFRLAASLISEASLKDTLQATPVDNDSGNRGEDDEAR